MLQSINLSGYCTLRTVLKVLPPALPCRRAISQDTGPKAVVFSLCFVPKHEAWHESCTEVSVRIFQSAIKSSWLLFAVSFFPTAHGVNKQLCLLPALLPQC